jgi:hypothetical protein
LQWPLLQLYQNQETSEPIAKLKNPYKEKKKDSNKDCNISFHLSKTKENRPQPAFLGDTLPVV